MPLANFTLLQKLHRNAKLFNKNLIQWIQSAKNVGPSTSYNEMLISNLNILYSVKRRKRFNFLEKKFYMKLYFWSSYYCYWSNKVIVVTSSD